MTAGILLFYLCRKDSYLFWWWWSNFLWLGLWLENICNVYWKFVFRAADIFAVCALHCVSSCLFLFYFFLCRKDSELFWWWWLNFFWLRLWLATRAELRKMDDRKKKEEESKQSSRDPWIMEVYQSRNKMKIDDSDFKWIHHMRDFRYWQYGHWSWLFIKMILFFLLLDLAESSFIKQSAQ